MEKRKRGRPTRGYPYTCGPYRHGAGWRLVIVTGRSGGRRTSYHRAFENREAAQQWAREFRRQIAAGGRTVEAAVIAYVDHLRRQGNKETSIGTTKHRLRALLDYSSALLDVNQTRAQEMYDELVDSGVAADTHRGCLIAGRAFGKFCVSKGWLTSNPFANVLPVGRKHRGKAQLRTDEARRLMRACLAAWAESQDRGAVATLLTLMFSMRASEVSQLVARDVDDKGRVLRIAEHQAKTAASVRAARVPAPLVPILLALADQPATEAGHLFALEDGTPADRHWVLRSAKRMMRSAGVPVLTAHGLRGTSATIGTVASGGAQVMADALGHEDAGITKAAYIDARAAADATTQRLADLLADDGENPAD
jgi:integrase